MRGAAYDNPNPERRISMKKKLSAVLAVVMTAAAVAIPTTLAEDGKKTFVIAGDSVVDCRSEISAAEMCAEYFEDTSSGCTFANMKSDKLVEWSANNASDYKNADQIVICVGMDEMIDTASAFFGQFAVKNNLLKEQYAGTETINFLDLDDLAKLDKSKVSALSSTKLSMFLLNLGKEIYGTAVKPGGVIYDRIMPNIETTVRNIHANAPDANIIISTIYNPLSFSEEYYDMRFGEGADYHSYETAIKSLKTEMWYYTDEFRTAVLDNVAVELRKNDKINVNVADFYKAFGSWDQYSDPKDSWGDTWYFTDIQKSGDERSYLPNRNGQLVMATEIIRTYNSYHDTTENCLLRTVMAANADAASYPAYAKSLYTKAVGELIEPDPTETPTEAPTESPTEAVTEVPTEAVTEVPTEAVTEAPTEAITEAFTEAPTEVSTEAPTEASTQAPAPVKLGDVNGDKEIDAIDASLVLAEYARKSTGKPLQFDDTKRAAADVNGDKEVDAVDASMILKYYSLKSTGKVPSFT